MSHGARRSFLRRKAAYRLRHVPAGALTVVVAAAIFVGIWMVLELRLRPVLSVAAQTQTENAVSALLEQAVTGELTTSAVGYSDFVTIQRDETGGITALSANMAALNLFRAELIGTVIQQLDGFDCPTVDIPVGSLLASQLFWAQGPTISVRMLRAGTVSAEFDSQFTSAGVNQTKHSLWLELSVPMTVLLPGETLAVPVSTRVCIAETVIVGQVPNTYFQLDGVSASG